MPTTPELIAHRGASKERPENSLAAFTRAAELGANAVELDVHLTSDGYLVVHHDPAVKTEAGALPIRSMTLADAMGLRVRGEPIPTLADVISAVGGKLRIYCELKGVGTAAPAAALLAPMGDGAAVHSFDHRMVAEAEALAPELARGVLEASYHRDVTFPLRDSQAEALWQNEALIDQALVDSVHDAGARVIAWTVNSPERARQLAAMGVDGLCTDDVAGIAAALGRSVHS
jgi:glycerophosphoryl diester phosphodiesterase